MESIQRISAAQALSPWIDPVNLLTGAEVRVERAYHKLLIEICRPAPSEMMRAFVAVYALTSAPVNGRIGK